MQYQNKLVIRRYNPAKNQEFVYYELFRIQKGELCSIDWEMHLRRIEEDILFFRNNMYEY